MITYTQEQGDEMNKNKPTLRDQFAMAALHNVMLNIIHSEDELIDLPAKEFASNVAKASYIIADAMLKAREEK